MKLKELIDVYVMHREYDRKVQVCRKDDWDKYDELEIDNTVIGVLENYEIIGFAAIAEDVIRVDLKWDEVTKNG